MIPAYPKIFALGTDYIRDIFSEPVEISEKVDGCFTYETQINLGDGTTEKIGKIVNNKIKANVPCVSRGGIVELKPIIGWRKLPPTDSWLKVRTAGDHGSDISFFCTPNHPLFTMAGWKYAGSIVPGRDLIMRRNSYGNPIQRQALFGTLLGDGCISKQRLAVGHSTKQLEYLSLKASVFESLGVRRDVRKSGYGSTMHRIHVGMVPEMKRAHEICVIDGKKRVTPRWLDELTPLSLAFWYMDDGSFQANKSQEGYALFHTNGFDKASVDALIGFLRDKYSLNASARFSKGWYIALDTPSSERFFSLIFPYVPLSMQYKLHPKFRGHGSIWSTYNWCEQSNEQLVPVEIKSIEKAAPHNKTRYDIEVADNHNFMVRGNVVHNSQFAFAKINGELQMRSKGASLYAGQPQKMFAAGMAYIESIQDRLPEGIIFYAEYLRAPKHNSLTYSRIPTNHFALFGVMDATQKCYGNIEEYAHHLGIDHVPNNAALPELQL